MNKIIRKFGLDKIVTKFKKISKYGEILILAMKIIIPSNIIQFSQNPKHKTQFPNHKIKTITDYNHLEGGAHEGRLGSRGAEKRRLLELEFI